ncbi:MAG TPA: CRISPR system precrRNA processing endoribonuclease RAMP protein Cas6 [Urbifossiella sp.]|jgi:hypothetical protein|nr:CRISPR system precrRNA processing endoribonuclease RAMP protein Cas6 [Urbifossiella sp.]
MHHRTSLPGVPAPPALRLPVLASDRVLRIARGGRLLPWLGPAVRGLVGGRLKVRSCRHPVADQVGRWRHCAGCPLRTGCAYGETVEGEPPGLPDGPRPLVVAPEYPCRETARPGDQILVRAVFIGPTAIGHAAAFWDAAYVAGADPGLGLGPDKVLFDILPAEAPDQTAEIELPLDPAAVPGVAPAVRVALTSPLVLQTRAGGSVRHLITRPTLAQLLAPWASLAGLFRYTGADFPPAAVARVAALAAGVPTLRAEFEPVRQVKLSHRTGDRWEEEGVVGWAEYGPVPAGLLPWLRWAGRLHVGGHRVAGAGGWGVEVLPAGPAITPQPTPSGRGLRAPTPPGRPG